MIDPQTGYNDDWDEDADYNRMCADRVCPFCDMREGEVHDTACPFADPDVELDA